MSELQAEKAVEPANRLEDAPSGDEGSEIERLRSENTRLTAELAAQGEELELSVKLLRRLNVTSQLMHACKDIKQILSILVDNAREYLAAERISVMIRNPTNDEISIQLAVGLKEDVVKTLRVKPWEGVAGTVLAQRAPVIVNGDGSPPGPDADGRYRSTCYMCVPMTLGGKGLGNMKVLGVVNVTDRVDDKPFRPIEVEFASHLARQAALALTGAALWQSTRGAGST